ncbi:hypothetical protein Z517_07197 [Fonsecaea pedrosoi CBS 271.37]|uniref:Uncharacterized protein n=1 Tax=Fonsecaea pedrosoi CBS 271.37 TaxID=1442368 RepID=A0A0D2DRS1_9EURO|nr:uncharacterized protein Z517_07197 [Fonsecaea pedrosoi CBS 271.37]KIW80581.1 hypothetical protein Z517_07197 [Fonsecaea pedrosoi CBS 271.37]
MHQLPRPASFRGLILLVAAFDLLLTSTTSYILPWLDTVFSLPDSLWLWAWSARESFQERCLICLSLNLALWICDVMESGHLFPWTVSVHARPSHAVSSASWDTTGLLFLPAGHFASTVSNITFALRLREPRILTFLCQVVRTKDIFLDLSLLCFYALLAIWIASKCCANGLEVVSRDLPTGTALVYECQAPVYCGGPDPFEVPVPGSFPVTNPHNPLESTEFALVESFSNPTTGYGRSSPTPFVNRARASARGSVFYLPPPVNFSRPIMRARRTFRRVNHDNQRVDNGALTFDTWVTNDDSSSSSSSSTTDSDYDADTELMYKEQAKPRDVLYHNATATATAKMVTDHMRALTEQPAHLDPPRRSDRLGRRNAWDWTNIPSVQG